MAKAMHYHLLMKRVPLIIGILLLLCSSINAQTQRPDVGDFVKDGLYVNSFFNFSFHYPKDWVAHGDATNERIRELGKEKTTKSGALSEASVDVALKNTYNLLTVFRHPLGTPGIVFNPAILVIAEKVAHAPGITNGRDYLLNVRALMLKDGSQSLLKEPVEYHFGGSQFFRDDFDLQANGVHVTQAYFANIAKGYAVVFIFMGEDQKSVDEMTKAMETFAVAPPVRTGVLTRIGVEPERKPN